MKRTINLLILVQVILPCIASAQQNADVSRTRIQDSMKEVYLDAYALKYPSLRQVTISQEFVAPGSIKSQLYGKDLFKGRVGISRTIANINLPVVTWGKNYISAGVGMTNQHFTLDRVNNYTSQYGIATGGLNKTTLNASVNYTRNDSLFGLPVIFNAGVSTVVDPGFTQQRLVYRALLTFSLIRNTNTSLSIGGLYLRDPSSPTPFVLFVSYAHKFKSIDAELLIDLPYRVALRKELTKRTSLAAFGTLEGNLSFFDLDKSLLPKNSIYSTLDVKAGMMFEYRFSRKMVFSVSGGMLATVTSKMSASDASTNDYFIKNTNVPVPYMNVGISLLPFLKHL